MIQAIWTPSTSQRILWDQWGVWENTTRSDCHTESFLTTIANILVNFFGTGCFYVTSLSTKVSLTERSKKSFWGIKSEGGCGVKALSGSVPGSLFYREVSSHWRGGLCLQRTATCRGEKWSHIQSWESLPKNKQQSAQAQRMIPPLAAHSWSLPAAICSLPPFTIQRSLTPQKVCACPSWIKRPTS